LTCQLKAAPDDGERLWLQADFDAMRAMRIKLGLGDTEANIQVREALHIIGQPTTTLWVEQASTAVPAITAEVYTVLGDGVDLPTEDEAGERIPLLSQYPAFSLYLADPPDFPGVAFVAVAANIWHLERPEATVGLRLSFSNPTDYTRIESHRHLNALTSSQHDQLMTAANSVFDQWMPDRRGRTPNDVTEVCTQFKAELPAALARARDALEFAGEPRRRPLRQHELATALGIDEDTLRVRLKGCKISWDELRRRQGGRTDSR
jgi:hypothetical protein